MKKILLPLVLVLAVPSVAQEIKSVLQQIEQNNITLQAVKQDNMAEATEAQTRNQLSGPSLEYSPFYRSGFSGIASSEFIARQEFDLPKQYKLRSQTAKAVEGMGEANYRVARRELLWQAVQMCIDLVQLHKNKTLLHERRNITNELHNLYEKKMAMGDATALDINKIKLDRIAIETEMDKNDAEIAELRLQLQTLNGGKPLKLDSLQYPVDHVHISLDQMIKERSQTDVELQANVQQQRLVDCQLQEARKSNLAKLSAGLRLNTEENQFSPGILVGVSFPLFTSKKQVRVVEARKQATILREQEIRNQMVKEMRSRVAAFQRYDKSLKSYDLDLLRSSLASLQKAVKMGEIPIIEYYIEAERIYEQWQTYYALEHDCQMIHAEIHRNEL